MPRLWMPTASLSDVCPSRVRALPQDAEEEEAMTSRIVVTSGDPATGVVTIEEAPMGPCEDYWHTWANAPHAVGRCRICNAALDYDEPCHHCGASWEPMGAVCSACNGAGRVPLSLPATVEVRGGSCRWEECNPDCDGYRLLGTATLDAWIDEGDGLVAYLTDWTPA